jgi:beta-glucosidase
MATCRFISPKNGAAFNDPAPDDEGHIRDHQRQQYFRGHLLAVRHAIAAGVDVRGYYAWSLFDNFEWAFGYAKRFGIIAVDYATQKRTLKDSAHYYRQVIAGNGRVLDGSEGES